MRQRNTTWGVEPIHQLVVDIEQPLGVNTWTVEPTGIATGDALVPSQGSPPPPGQAPPPPNPLQSTPIAVVRHGGAEDAGPAIPL